MKSFNETETSILVFFFHVFGVSKANLYKFCLTSLHLVLYVRLSLLTMTNPNQLCDVLLFVCSKVADETSLSSKQPVADRTRES